MTQEELNNRLLNAAANNNTEVKGLIAEVEGLIAKGADVNAVDEDGHRPLHYAVIYGHTKIVESLIAAQADVNAKVEDGQTPLHLAVIYGHTKIVESLIAAQADVNALIAQDENRMNPLYFAASYGDIVSVRALIAAGANFDTEDDDKKTPFDNARNRGDKFYNEVIDATAKRINDTQRAEAFIMGSHDRLGEGSPVKMIGGEPGYMQEILGKVVPLKLSDIPEKGGHRKEVEEQLNKLQEKKPPSHVQKLLQELKEKVKKAGCAIS